MKAVILVGGEGTRLRPLTYSTPKPLLPIANVAFLDRQIAWLAAHGVTEVTLSLGYLPAAFAEHYPRDRFDGVTIRYAVEDQPLGTAGGIRYAAHGIDERLVVCNGDILTDLDLAEVVAFHDRVGAEATIALTQVSDPSAFGVVPTRDDGSVIAFVEKPPRGTAPTDWINAGTYVLEPSILERIPPRLAVSIERETFPRMLESGGKLFAVASDAYWVDIGTPEKYLDAHRDVLAGRVGGPGGAGARELSTGIWSDGDVDIDARARIEPPVLLGAGATVAAGGVVRSSVLGPGSHVESGATVERAVLGARARISTGAQVSDSVVAADAVLKPDAQATDGTMIGEGATVATGTHLAGAKIPPGD